MFEEDDHDQDADDETIMMMDAFRHMSDRVRGLGGLNDVLSGVSQEA